MTKNQLNFYNVKKNCIPSKNWLSFEGYSAFSKMQLPGFAFLFAYQGLLTRIGRAALRAKIAADDAHPGGGGPGFGGSKVKAGNEVWTDLRRNPIHQMPGLNN
jgi:hypothetical protein